MTEAPPQTEQMITASAARRPGRPYPLGSLVASARRLTSQTMANRSMGGAQGWQDDSWEMFDLVGELRFLAVTLAQRLSQARFYLGRLAPDSTEAPEPVTDPALTGILDSIGASPSARQQLIARLGVNLFVPGEGWLAGIPRHLIPVNLLVGGSLQVDPELTAPAPPADGKMNITDLEWRMLSVNEVKANVGGGVQIILGETPDDVLLVNPNEIFLIRVWRPHPRKWWEADSPTRSCLPVLRELVGLTMRSGAEIDSRLAGAGLLLVPQSAQNALRSQAGLPGEETDEDGEVPDPFTMALIEAMMKPISDRASASAVVPLVATVPDETAALFRHLTFSTELDITAGEREDKAIRRLALGLDAPPELLLGTGGMNHWGAWLVLEDVVTTHLEPPLALICDALTTQFLWPVLADQKIDEATARDLVIWYDVSDLVVRPNRGADAQALHDKNVISDRALRTATGFDESDAPPSLPREVELALAAAAAAPSLFAAPGLPALVEQIRAVLSGDTSGPSGAPVPVPAAGPGTADGSPQSPASGPPPIPPQPVPNTQNEPAQPAPGAVAAGAAPLDCPVCAQGMTHVGSSCPLGEPVPLVDRLNGVIDNLTARPDPALLSLDQKLTISALGGRGRALSDSRGTRPHGAGPS